MVLWLVVVAIQNTRHNRFTDSMSQLIAHVPWKQQLREPQLLMQRQVPNSKKATHLFRVVLLVLPQSPPWHWSSLNLNVMWMQKQNQSSFEGGEVMLHSCPRERPWPLRLKEHWELPKWWKSSERVCPACWWCDEKRGSVQGGLRPESKGAICDAHMTADR